MINTLHQLSKIFYSVLFFDFIQLYFAGIMRAVMKEGRAIAICSITEFCIGIPLAYWLAYKMEFGVIGIWFIFLVFYLVLKVWMEFWDYVDMFCLCLYYLDAGLEEIKLVDC